MRIIPIGEMIAADIQDANLSQPLDDVSIAAITKAWNENLVLRFRNQHLSDADLIRFSSYFGELDPPGPNPYGVTFLPEFPEINVISNVKDDTGVPIGNLGDGEAVWHADMTYRALDAFEELLRRYPESQYARDSKLKADLARSQLAGKEMAVGRFYLKEGHINAAIKRFATVVKEYDQTNQVPEALYRMVESYLSLGLTDEADRVAQVANYNFPDSYWTEQVNLVVENPGRAGPRGLIGSIADRALPLF